MAQEQGPHGHVVRVPERGHAEVDATAWRRLSASSEFWDLVERKIVAVSSPRRGRVRLTGGSHVGRARIDGVALELHEKVPDALTSLLRHLGHGSLRMLNTPSPLSDLNELAKFLVHTFLVSVREYVGRGRERRYVSEGHVGSLVGGRIDVTRTLRMRARGLPHLAAFDRNELVFDTPLNRVVYAALVEAEQLDRALHLSPRDLAAARALSVAFADCRDAKEVRVRREAIVRYASDVAERTEDPARRDIATLAGVVLSHESFSPAGPSDRFAPRAWFLSLETLFESAVRAILARELGSSKSGRLWPRESVTRRIFPKAPDKITAHPDLVIEAHNNVMVGDVKYKAWERAAGAPDLYQLLVHAKTYDAQRCFLVYPHDTFEAVHLGVSTTGCDTWLFAVDIRKLEQGLTNIIQTVNSLADSIVVETDQRLSL